MPGRKPSEAFRRFIEPLQSAVTCLDDAKLTISPRGRADANTRHGWYLNGGKGLSQGQLTFKAKMLYEIVPNSRVGLRERWKVSTLGYMYQIDIDDHALVEYHWHPGPGSTHDEPHMHMGAAGLVPSGVIVPRTHLPTARISLEEVVRLLIQEFGWEPKALDWENRLLLSEGIFKLYRSWHSHPTDQNP